MNRATVVAWLSAFLLFAALTSAQAQATTLRGTVSQVSHPDGTGTHVWLENAGKTQEVCLGQSRYLEDNSFVPKVGDVIDVTGGLDGRVFVADTFGLGGRTLNLQDRGRVGPLPYYSGHHCFDHHPGKHHDCSHGNHHDRHE